MRGRTTWKARQGGSSLFLQWIWVIDEGGIVLIENPLKIATHLVTPHSDGESGAHHAVRLECLNVSIG